MGSVCTVGVSDEADGPSATEGEPRHEGPKRRLWNELEVRRALLSSHAGIVAYLYLLPSPLCRRSSVTPLAG